MPKEQKVATRSSARLNSTSKQVPAKRGKSAAKESPDATEKATKKPRKTAKKNVEDEDLADEEKEEDSESKPPATTAAKQSKAKTEATESDATAGTDAPTLSFSIVNSDSCSTYKSQVKRVSKIITASYPSAQIAVSKGKFGSFDISLSQAGGKPKVLFEGSKLGPPRTLKWVEESVLLDLIAKALE